MPMMVRRSDNDDATEDDAEDVAEEDEAVVDGIYDRCCCRYCFACPFQFSFTSFRSIISLNLFRSEMV